MIATSDLGVGIRSLDGNSLGFDGKYMSKKDGKTKQGNAN